MLIYHIPAHPCSCSQRNTVILRCGDVTGSLRHYSLLAHYYFSRYYETSVYNKDSIEEALALKQNDMMRVVFVRCEQCTSDPSYYVQKPGAGIEAGLGWAGLGWAGLGSFIGVRT